MGILDGTGLDWFYSIHQDQLFFQKLICSFVAHSKLILGSKCALCRPFVRVNTTLEASFRHSNRNLECHLKRSDHQGQLFTKMFGWLGARLSGCRLKPAMSNHGVKPRFPYQKWMTRIAVNMKPMRGCMERMEGIQS